MPLNNAYVNVFERESVCEDFHLLVDQKNLLSRDEFIQFATYSKPYSLFAIVFGILWDNWKCDHW